MNTYFSFLLLLFTALFFSCSTLGERKSENNPEISFQNDSFFEDETPTPAQETKPPIEDKKVIAQKDNVEVGYAAWYGKELHGKPTASGAIFNMNDYTAAHRTIPIGSQVMVTNLANEKKRMVTINDRGPYVEGRIIDVSYKTAIDLGFVEKGIAKVKIEVVKRGDFSFLSKLTSPTSDVVTKEFKEVKVNEKEQPAEEENEFKTSVVKLNNKNNDYIFSNLRQPKGYTIQVGAFENKQNAENYRDEMEERFNHRSVVVSHGKWHFVWVGEFTSSDKAKNMMKKFKEEGIETFYRGKMF